MDAMKKAIMKRRMMLAGDIDMDEMKDADMNPDEGSMDDLEIARKKEGMDGLAPDIADRPEGNSGDVEMEIEMEKQEPEGMDDRAGMLQSLLSEDDIGKPGIKGKTAAKIMEALKKLKG